VIARPGDQVAEHEPVLMVHHRGGAGLPEALALLAHAIEVEDTPRAEAPIVVARLGGHDR
jgi:thymidine phosphorylase